MKDLADILPGANNRSKTLTNRQSSKDIAKAVLMAEKHNRIYTPILKDFFRTPGTPLQDLNKAFNYVIEKITYKAEKDPQTVKTLPRLLKDKQGDCKHFATIMANIARSLGFEYFFRLTSYNKFIKEPTHIYICVVVKDKIIPVDPVYKIFGEEKAYFFKYDYKPLK